MDLKKTGLGRREAKGAAGWHKEGGPKEEGEGAGCEGKRGGEDWGATGQVGKTGRTGMSLCCKGAVGGWLWRAASALVGSVKVVDKGLKESVSW